MRTRASTTPTSRRVLLVYLAALVGREPNGLLEVRWRHDIGMKRRVYRVADELAAAAEEIQRLGARTDVYVGCAPRRQRAGGLAAIGRVWVLWVDCDTPRAISALNAFGAQPAIIVRSGSGCIRHAYWTLTRGLSATTQRPPTSASRTPSARTLAQSRTLRRSCDHRARRTSSTTPRPPGAPEILHPLADRVSQPVRERCRSSNKNARLVVDDAYSTIASWWAAL